MNKKQILLILLLSLLVASLACSLFGGGENAIDGLDDAAPPAAAETAPEDVSDDDPASGDTEIEEADPVPLDEASEGEIAPETGEEQTQYDTIFPLPRDVQNFMNLGGDMGINFQTSLSIEDAIDFYRQTFESQNLIERNINTSITDGVFSMVFDGHSSGKTIVIQGVDLGDGTTNINIRFEDL